MYDRISLLRWLRLFEDDIIEEDVLQRNLTMIKADQKEKCDLIEFSDYINFYHMTGMDYTHIFHLGTIDENIIKQIDFASEITIEYIPSLNLDRLSDIKYIPAYELISLISYLVDNGYAKLMKIDSTRFKIKK